MTTINSTVAEMDITVLALIEAEALRCLEAAIEQGYDGDSKDYELTDADMVSIVDACICAFERRPTKAEWADCGYEAACQYCDEIDSEDSDSEDSDSEDYGTLMDADTAEEIGPATREQREASEADGPEGNITIISGGSDDGQVVPAPMKSFYVNQRHETLRRVYVMF